MLENLKKVDNPLTIIAYFCGLSEIAMAAAAIWGNAEIAGIFIWFVLGFPPFLVTLFFLTLNFNHKVLYAPSDFRTDDAFIGLIRKELKDNLDQIGEEVVEIKDKVAELPRSEAEVNGGVNLLETAVDNVLDRILQMKRSINDRVSDNYIFPIQKDILLSLNQGRKTWRQLRAEDPRFVGYEFHQALRNLENRGYISVVDEGQYCEITHKGAELLLLL